MTEQKSFRISNEPIDSEALRKAMEDGRAGAFVSFEGRVRDHNEGKSVTSLEYEASVRLAEKEGARIVADAVEKYELVGAVAVHRAGHLGIGDVAVWVGVLGVHRGEAFSACREIIDEIKHRVPIWKKEYYADGSTGWVNCATCGEFAATAHAPHSGCAT